jgi:Ubiquitin carboxyl-terminal hydrolase
MTLNPRQLVKNGKDEDGETDEGDKDDAKDVYPSKAERAEIEEHLAVYGDEKECRQVDTDPLVIAMAVSRSLWPRTESELKRGLRVDVKDHRGVWVPASVVEVLDDNDDDGSDTEKGQEVEPQPKKVRVHPDIASPKWDEFYTLEHFKKGKVSPLYSEAEPKSKSFEFLMHHRCVDKTSNQPAYFGQSFYIQCHKEWTNARAGAHILAQTSRFLRQKVNASDSNRLVEKVQSSISELIDLLIDCDREFVKLVLGVSKHNSDEERARAYRNAQFDTTAFILATNKKVSTMLHRLPFELRLVTPDSHHPSKYNASGDESPFSFALNSTIGNCIRPNSNCILHWREPPIDKKSSSQRIARPSILYVEPQLHTHESSAELLKASNGGEENGKKAKPGIGGIDLGFCLSEFCKIQKLPMSDNWKCPRCKVIREGGQNMNLWRLPDLLTFHIKRFNMSARWHEKITTKVNFPMTGLDMSEWCHKESPVLREDCEGSYIYDLIGVMNHYGSMTGGHYIATCKATHCGRDGKEEVAYNFNGVGASYVEPNGSDEPSGFFLSRAKPKNNKSHLDATLSSQAVADSAEPTWLQFDDEIVEAIPPRHVVSEMAYVLFYRKRRITPSNIAKYSTLE